MRLPLKLLLLLLLALRLKPAFMPPLTGGRPGLPTQTLPLTVVPLRVAGTAHVGWLRDDGGCRKAGGEGATDRGLSGGRAGGSFQRDTHAAVGPHVTCMGQARQHALLPLSGMCNAEICVVTRTSTNSRHQAGAFAARGTWHVAQLHRLLPACLPLPCRRLRVMAGLGRWLVEAAALG